MDDTPTLTLNLDWGYKIDPKYKCPLRRNTDATLGEITLSATNGCSYCILRVTAVRQIWFGLIRGAEISFGNHDHVFNPLVHLNRQPYDSFDLVSDRYSKNTSREDFFDFYHGPGLPQRSWNYVVPCDTGSSISLKSVQTWIKACDEEHTCMRNVGAKLPRRVLDVRNNHVRLHETTNTDQGTRYACLSHCWGIDSSATLRTTTFNLKAHRKEIPCSGLPRTFRDAVSFTRRLNVDFLWIDSLCIIQNDARDWQQQSANMAAIYKNGYITLAATSSYNAEGGCYTQKNGPPSHQVIGPPVAVLRYPDGTEGPIFVRRTFKHAQTSFPLLQRGWVFQERLLSPRILHFADEELIWECKQSVRCECGSTETKNGFSRISAYVEERETPFSNLEPLSKQNHALASWNLVVSDYAACSLTYQRDAFPALSGIAKVFAASLQDEYVAGLWKSTLVSQLLWYFRSINGETVTKVNTWRAPSWSWVSVNWRYKFLTLPVTKELAELKHVVCKASGDDPTGELQTAYLTLRTRVIPATLGHVLNGGLSSYHLYLGNELVFPRKSIPRFYSLDDAETGYFDLSDHRLANDITSLGVVVAQVASWSGIRTIYIRGHVPDEVRFYLLLARDIKDNRHWVRIGLMVVTAYNRNVSLCYCANQNSMTSEQKAKEFEERKHEISSHPIFDLFDEAEAQDITIW